MKQEILTLEQEQVADMLLSLKNSHRRINRFMQEYTPPLNGDRYLTDREVSEPPHLADPAQQPCAAVYPAGRQGTLPGV